MIDTLLFSDCHIGTFQTTMTIEKMNQIIKKYKPGRIVFAGDLFDMYADPDAVETFSEIKHDNIVYVVGNHDADYSGIQEYSFNIGEKRFLVFHGHKYSTTDPKWEHFGTRLNEFFLRYTGVNFQKFFRKVLAKPYPEGSYLPSLYHERGELLNEYADSSFDTIISGHTHYPEHFESDSLEYINLGNWNNFATISDKGVVQLHWRECEE